MPDLTAAVGAELAPQRTQRLICPLPNITESSSHASRFLTFCPSSEFQLSFTQAETLDGTSPYSGLHNPLEPPLVCPPVPTLPPGAVLLGAAPPRLLAPPWLELIGVPLLAPPLALLERVDEVPPLPELPE